MDKPIPTETLINVGGLVQGLGTNMPDRFFEIYNDLVKRYPGITHEMKEQVAWAQIRHEKKEKSAAR